MRFNMFNKFICTGRKPRIKASILQKKVKQGGLALPNITLYYHAPMLQWWNWLTMTSWVYFLEQIEFLTSLPEWVLTCKEFRSAPPKDRNSMLGNVLKIWKNYNSHVAPRAVTIPKFKTVASYTDFSA